MKRFLKTVFKLGLLTLLLIGSYFLYLNIEEHNEEQSLKRWKEQGMSSGLRNGEDDAIYNRPYNDSQEACGGTEKQVASYRENYVKGYKIGWERGKDKRSSGYSNNEIIKSSGKIHFSELEFRKGQKYAYKNGEAFSGTAWSSDEKSFSMTADGGVVIGAKAYHSNGRVAIDGDPVNKIRTHYDEYGNVMSEAEFKSKYPHIMQKVKAFSYEIKEID